jgi:hypothetical protein
MKQALFVMSGVAVGLLAAFVAVTWSKSELMAQVEAQAGPAAGGSGSGIPTILGTGGGTNNVNDLCWVLSRVKPAKGPERTVLAMYRAKRNGEYFDLEDVRMIDADLRVFELKGSVHSKETSVEEILKKLPRDERETIVPRNP